MLFGSPTTVPVRRQRRVANRFNHLWDLAVLMVVCLVTTATQAQTNFQRILSFDTPSTSGRQPSAKLVESRDGMLYGMTSSGGPSLAGTLFRLNKDGSGHTLLLSFTNGPYLFGGLLEGTDGKLYGVRSGGGTAGKGIVFSVNRDASEWLVLHDFTGADSNHDGSTPLGTLIQGSDGKLYGTTQAGGSNNLGTVFTVNTNGNDYAILHHFSGALDGSNPAAGLVEVADGMLYGTTQTGGSNDLGTVFKLSSDGLAYTALHTFGGIASNDGAQPTGGILEGSDGYLYGTTESGGIGSDLGTLFKVDTNGNNYALLHVFASVEAIYPKAGLAQGPDGMLFGTTRLGGASGAGTVFHIATDGSGYAIVHDFSATNGDGSQPFASLLATDDGALYGSTYFGGNTGGGILFRLSDQGVQITRLDRNGSSALLTLANGDANRTYEIQAIPQLGSTNTWTTLGSTNAAIDGNFQFSDPDASVYQSRFYRTRIP